MDGTRRHQQTLDMADLGYDPDFLDTTIAVPAATHDGPVLDYEHFTLQMHPARRLASWVAWNIDGLRLFPSEDISRAGQRFRADPRIPADAQTLEEAYADNDLDRGHVARRSDLLWGTLAEAERANSDSFFFTNITPQHQDFNQSGRGGVWGLLENAVLAQEGLVDRRVTVMAGPVLSEDDPPYRDLLQLPRDHWKAVVYRLGGSLRFRCFVLTQDLDGIGERDYLDDVETWQVPLAELETRTGLAFPGLAPLTADDVRTRPPVLVREVADVAW